MSTVTDLAPTGTLSFHQALDMAEVLARHALDPALHERLSCAVALVKAGAVFQTDDGHTWTVASASTPGQEAPVAVSPSVAPESVPQPAAPAVPPALPEAPVSITLKATLHGHEVLVTLRGTDFASVQAQVEQASAWLRSQSSTTPAAACASATSR